MHYIYRLTYVLFHLLDKGCPPLPYVDNAHSIGASTDLGSVTVMKCDEGNFFWDGTNEKTVRCTLDGEWDQEVDKFTCKGQ